MDVPSQFYFGSPVNLTLTLPAILCVSVILYAVFLFLLHGSSPFSVLLKQTFPVP